MKKVLVFTSLVILLLVSAAPASAASNNKSLGINVLLNTEITDEILATLGGFGKVNDLLPAINGLTMKVKVGDLAEVQALPFVAAANPDAERKGAPIDTVSATDFSDGISTWDLDAINVVRCSDLDNRQVPFDGDRRLCRCIRYRISGCLASILP